MNTKQSDLLITQIELILEESKNLKGKGRTVRGHSNYVEYLYFIRNIDLLAEQFNLIANKVSMFLKDEGIDETIEEIPLMGPTMEEIRANTLYNTDAILLKLIFGCSKILTFLRPGTVLPEVTLNKLDSLSKELRALEENLDTDIFNNLGLSTESFEKGCFLGSSLISGRVLINSFNQIEGKDINEKVDELKRYDLVREKDGKDSIMKANHFGRNLTSHNLKIIPSSSEAISYLGDAIKIAKLVSEYNIKKNSESQPKA